MPGINNIIGISIFAVARGSYHYLQVSGGTYLMPATPSNQTSKQFFQLAPDQDQMGVSKNWFQNLSQKKRF